jgi:two-component system cell cycle sensor histidine kinase PleC
VARTHLGELFFKERMLRLPLATSRWSSIAISERVLRNLITLLIGLFLISLAGALIFQLSVSRNAHIEDHNKLSLLYAQLAAQHLRSVLTREAAGGAAQRIPVQEDIEAAIPPPLRPQGRIFALTDASGLIRAALPEQSELVGKQLYEILSPREFMPGAIEQDTMKLTRLASGSDAYAMVRALDPYPGSLAVIELRSELLSTWRSDVTHISALFITTLAVLVLLGGAFHWQAARAADADRTLAVATERLDKALDRGRCGLWDWDIARGRIFWSRSMFNMLGLEPRRDFLSYGEVAEKLHADDEPIENFAEMMLKGERGSFDREFRMRHSEGHFIWLRARAELAAAPGGKHLGSLRAVGCRQPAGDVQLEVPAVPQPADERVRAGHALRRRGARRQGAGGAAAGDGGLWSSAGRKHVRSADRRRAMAADQRAAHEGWRIRVGGHGHHGAQAA